MCTDLLGSAAFSVVKNDMNGNVKVRSLSQLHHLFCPRDADLVTRLSQKIRDRYDSNPAGNSTLELLVDAEKTEKKKTATEGLLWLIRYTTLLVPIYLHKNIVLMDQSESDVGD